MNAKELGSKTGEDLEILLRELHEKLGAMRSDLSQGKVKNTASIRAVRKDIARIETVRRERQVKQSK